MKRRVLLICLLSLCLTGLCLVPSSQADTPAKTLYAERDVLAVSRELDGIIHHALTEAKVPPSGLSSDAEFMRRLSLDLCGRIPRPDRVIRFLEDKSPDKRRKLIEEFLSDPEYGEHFGIIWYHRLVKRTMDNTQIISNNFEDWLAQEFNKNTPWDEIVRKVLMAEGERDKNPPTVFYLAHSEGNKQPEVQPARVVATMSQMFMGVRLECCECHNHPFDDGLKQTDFWGVAAFFNGMHASHTGKRDETIPVITETFAKARPKRRPVDGQREYAPFGQIVIPDSNGKTEKARFLLGEAPTLSQSQSPRLVFLDWLTAQENPYFARSFVNKMWANFFGKGIIDPIDDMRDLSQATHPELLELLAREFTESGYDIKHLIRCIVSSQTYQRTSIPLPENKDDKTLYSRMPVKVMSADMLFDSLQVVMEKSFLEPENRRARQQAQRKGRGGPREQFRKFFHAEADDDAGVTEEYSHGIPQVLRLMNDSRLNNLNSLITSLMRNEKKPEKIIQSIYLRVLSRPATEPEITRMKKFLEGDREQKRAYSDIFWALLNSSEFVFNH